MTQSLFVYGSLAPGRPNAHILAPLGGTWQPATVCGHLRPQGWGAALGFPGLELDEAGGTVSGIVFTSEQLAGFWETLDSFEGEQYARVTAAATLEDGSRVDAWVYALRSG